jgi:hypothetical protein
MKTFLIFCLCFVSFFSYAQADFGFELIYSQSFANNLLLDSNELNDSYSSTNAKIFYYPISQVEINLTSGYSYYDDLVGLGNVTGGAGITIIPFNSKSPFSIYLNSNFTTRSYRSSYRAYNTHEIDVMASIGYNLSRRIKFRSGISYENNTYINSDGDDKETYELFIGTNITPFGSNSIDLEAGYSYANAQFIELDTVSFPPDHNLNDGKLKSYYISPRFSRPIGKKLGLSITYTYSRFMDVKDHELDYLVYSYATGNLSPWASVYEGDAITFNLKSYMIPNTIMAVGMGYWEKNYLWILEGLDSKRSRNDVTRKYYLSFSRPIPTQTGMLIEPSIQISFANNDSINNRARHTLFHYNDFLMMVGLKITM